VAAAVAAVVGVASWAFVAAAAGAGFRAVGYLLGLLHAVFVAILWRPSWRGPQVHLLIFQ
jgi:uncharacterized membrane protein YqaE (UPF0057 family)